MIKVALALLHIAWSFRFIRVYLTSNYEKLWLRLHMAMRRGLRILWGESNKSISRPYSDLLISLSSDVLPLVKYNYFYPFVLYLNHIFLTMINQINDVPNFSWSSNLCFSLSLKEGIQIEVKLGIATMRWNYDLLRC